MLSRSHVLRRRGDRARLDDPASRGHRCLGVMVIAPGTSEERRVLPTALFLAGLGLVPRLLVREPLREVIRATHVRALARDPSVSPPPRAACTRPCPRGRSSIRRSAIARDDGGWSARRSVSSKGASSVSRRGAASMVARRRRGDAVRSSARSQTRSSLRRAAVSIVPLRVNAIAPVRVGRRAIRDRGPGAHLTRSMYSPVRVSIRIFSPGPMKGGTWILRPVSRIASLY